MHQGRTRLAIRARHCTMEYVTCLSLYLVSLEWSIDVVVGQSTVDGEWSYSRRLNLAHPSCVLVSTALSYRLHRQQLNQGQMLFYFKTKGPGRPLIVHWRMDRPRGWMSGAEGIHVPFPQPAQLGPLFTVLQGFAHIVPASCVTISPLIPSVFPETTTAVKSPRCSSLHRQGFEF